MLNDEGGWFTEYALSLGDMNELVIQVEHLSTRVGNLELGCEFISLL